MLVSSEDTLRKDGKADSASRYLCKFAGLYLFSLKQRQCVSYKNAVTFTKIIFTCNFFIRFFQSDL